MTIGARGGGAGRYVPPMPSSRAHLVRRAGRGVVLVLALVAVLAAVACGGDDDTATTGPAVAVQDDRIPVARSDELEPRIEMLAETGAKVARLDLFWSSIAPTEPADPTDPADPAYDFSQADFVLSGYAERGIDTIVSVYNTPAWAARNGQGPPAGTPINNNFPKADAFGDFMGAVAARYSGTFQLDGADQPLPETSHFEIWNEPNFRSFLGPQVDEGRLVAADAYAEMAKAAYPAIKRANPEAIVIVGVGGPRGASGEGATGARPWLQALRERDIPLDAYSQHIYPAAAPDVETIAFPSWSSIDGFLQELDEWKPGLDLYITEAGLHDRADAVSKVPRHRGPAGAVPDGDLRAPPGRSGAGRGHRLVQPAGQRVLARRTDPGRRHAQAELRRLHRGRRATRCAAPADPRRGPGLERTLTLPPGGRPEGAAVAPLRRP